ncbi:P-loop NTPase fold protein [Paraburkholderia xenovorans]|uniref:P-loop NTPase fold protein n=1 Tax=Paraburkholderia xenovorans TaxID=36873 RepID=UPI0038B91835
MNQAQAQQALQKYLTDPGERVRVIALKGPWGSGKTYVWTRTRAWLSDRAREDDPAPLYCSLFGLNSVSDIRRELLAQVLDDQVAGGATAFRAAAKVQRTVETVLGAFGKVFDAGAKLGGYVVNAASDALTDRLARGRLIVLDDMERRGDALSVVEVLGFVDSLGRQGSKVLILFNDEKIGAGKPHDELQAFREKAFDVELELRTSPEETYEISCVGETPPYEAALRRHFCRLGVTNIRVGQRIVSTARRIYGSAPPLPDEVVEETMPCVVATTALFFKALPDWEPLEVVVQQLARHYYALQKLEGVVDRDYLPKPPASIQALQHVEFEFMRIVMDHVATGALLEERLRQYWECRLARYEADELIYNAWWSPGWTVQAAIERGDSIFAKGQLLDKPRLERLKKIYSRYLGGPYMDMADQFLGALPTEYEYDAFAEKMTSAPPGTDIHAVRVPAGNQTPLKQAVSDYMLQSETKLTEAEWRVSNELIESGTAAEFEQLFSTTDAKDFARAVQFLGAWLERHSDKAHPEMAKALQNVLAREDGYVRRGIFERVMGENKLAEYAWQKIVNEATD